jgi:hypothetical protein
MAGPGETLKSPWPPFPIHPCLRISIFSKFKVHSQLVMAIPPLLTHKESGSWPKCAIWYRDLRREQDHKVVIGVLSEDDLGGESDGKSNVMMRSVGARRYGGFMDPP